jgi:hypothetical protein
MPIVVNIRRAASDAPDVGVELDRRFSMAASAHRSGQAQRE